MDEEHLNNCKQVYNSCKDNLFDNILLGYLGGADLKNSSTDSCKENRIIMMALKILNEKIDSINAKVSRMEGI